MTDQKFTDLIADILDLMPTISVLSTAPDTFVVSAGGELHRVTVTPAAMDDNTEQRWYDDVNHAQLEDTTFDGAFANGVTLGGMANDS